MKNFIALLFLGFLISSCGDDDCKTCKGELFGETVDGTICDNGDGTTTATDNVTGDVTTDSLTLEAQIMLAEGFGLDCN